MSYTRPLQSAADATWLNAPAYTRPLQAAADANFLDAPQVTGFMPVRFGGPHMVLPVTGFAPVNFGIPTVPMLVTSTRPVNFGTPILLRIDGIKPVNFGTPALFGVSGFNPVNFGTPFLPTVEGFNPVHFGTPVFVMKLRVTPTRPVRFGQATSPHLIQGTATGFKATRFGTRTSLIRWLPVVNRSRHRIRRLRPVHFGRPFL